MRRTTEAAPLRIVFCTGLLLGLLVISVSPVIPFLHDRKQHKVIELENRIESLKSADPDAFISVWDTTKVSLESSNSDQVKLPLEFDGTYDFFVDWGDGNNYTIAIWNQTESTHTYSTTGIYTIQITGIIEGWCFNHERDRLKIIEIRQWGCLRLGNNGNYFDGCENLVCNAYDNLNLTGGIGRNVSAVARSFNKGNLLLTLENTCPNRGNSHLAATIAPAPADFAYLKKSCRNL